MPPLTPRPTWQRMPTQATADSEQTSVLRKEGAGAARFAQTRLTARQRVVHLKDAAAQRFARQQRQISVLALG
jgi:hypothetical protein